MMDERVKTFLGRMRGEVMSDVIKKIKKNKRKKKRKKEKRKKKKKRNQLVMISLPDFEVLL